MKKFLIGLFVGLAMTTLSGQVWVHAPTAGKLVKIGCTALGELIVLPDTLDATLGVTVTAPVVTTPTPPPVQPPAPATTWVLKVDDTFAGQRNDPLSAHAPLTGSGWEASENFLLALPGVLGNSFAPDVARNVTALPPDQAVAVTLAEVNNPVALVVRLDSLRKNGYVVIWRANVFADLQFAKLVDGVLNPLASIGQVSGAAGNVVRVEAKGPTFTVKINDVVKLTAGDSMFATGSVGYMSVMGNANQVTHFSAWAAQ